MTATAEPPPSVGSAMPPSSGEIHVSRLVPASTPTPTNVPAEKILSATEAKSSAVVRPPFMSPETKVVDDGKKPWAKMTENLNKYATEANTPEIRKPKEVAKPVEAAAPEKPADERMAEEGLDDEAPVAKAPELKPGEKPTEAVDKKKTNPWKVIDEHKKARAQLEAEVADLKKITANPELRKQEVERLTAVEKRNQELEEHIKFVDYSKSKDFTEKYQKPYEAAWTRAMSELKELTVADATTGETRAMVPADLLELVNMPLLKAKMQAEDLYGSAASDVMAYRKEIKGLFEQQSQALDAARKSGVEKAKADAEQMDTHMAAIKAQTSKHWEAINKDIIANETTGPYFRQVDGNEDINRRLDSGYKFVDDTMAVNPLDPKLNQEQRQDAIKRHASLRHRAAAFGRMRYELESERKEHKATKAKLAEFEKSVPKFGGDGGAAMATLPDNGKMSGLMQRLRAKAV